MTTAKTLYITGSTGFIGNHLLEFYKDKDLEIIRLDRGHLGNLDSFNFKESADIIHLAARVHQMNVTDFEEDNRLHHEVNYQLPIDLYKKFNVESKTGKFLFASTVHVHANTTEGIFSSDDIARPESAYGKWKLKAEKELLEISKKSDADLIIFRLPMVYGPGNKGNILKLISAARRGLMLPLGDLTHLRSVVYVKNIAFTLNEILQKKLDNGIYFITDSEDQSSKSLYNTIFNTLNSKSGTFYFPSFILYLGALLGSFLSKCTKRNLPLSLDVYKRLNSNYRFDGATLIKKLGTTLPYSFEDGIKETVEYYSGTK